MRRLPLLLALAALPALPLSMEASAQVGGGRMAPMPGADPASRPPPAGLPGLTSRRPVEPIPAEAPSASLAPNAALFDAVNRGDLAAAKEAMSRGADLNSRNQLGLTALDSAVDQGRQEIVFYLLSARGSSGSGSAGPAPEASAAPAAPARRGGRNAPQSAPPASAPSSFTAPREVAPARPTRPLDAPPRGGMPAGASTAPVRAPLFSGDGGTARPEAGFLGFDAGRPAGAEPQAAPSSSPSRRARPAS